MKGAELDLRKVALEEETVDISVKDSLAAILDSLYALGIDFSIKIDPKVLDENEEMKDRLAELNRKLEAVKDYVPPPEEKEPRNYRRTNETTISNFIKTNVYTKHVEYCEKFRHRSNYGNRPC